MVAEDVLCVRVACMAAEFYMCAFYCYNAFGPSVVVRSITLPVVWERLRTRIGATIPAAKKERRDSCDASETDTVTAKNGEE